MVFSNAPPSKNMCEAQEAAVIVLKRKSVDKYILHKVTAINESSIIYNYLV